MRTMQRMMYNIGDFDDYDDREEGDDGGVVDDNLDTDEDEGKCTGGVMYHIGCQEWEK